MRYIVTLAASGLLGFAVSAQAEVPRVVTDFGPVQSLVQQVMGDLGTPTMLLPAGGDPHDFQMRPSQARALHDADLIVWDGPELMPALADAIAALGGGAVSLPLLHQGGGRTRQFADGGTDPHAWLDPLNGIAWLGSISKALATQDPAHAAVYKANAAAAETRLHALDAALADELAPLRDRPFVVFHDALGYFADHYGLNVAGAIELGDAAAPSAARLVEIRSALAASKAVCIFPEAGRDPKFIAAVAEGSPARIGPAQDVEAITLIPGPGLYTDLLHALARTLTDCLLPA